MSNAFLHGVLEEDVYMRQPPGFKDDSRKDHICKLQKAIYGLRQSTRAWFRRLRDFLVSVGFKESISDQSLFIYSKDEVVAYFLVYVDNMVLTSSSDQFVEEIIKKLGNEFALKDLGVLGFFLGIHLKQLHNGDVLISQEQYLATLL